MISTIPPWMVEKDAYFFSGSFFFLGLDGFSSVSLFNEDRGGLTPREAVVGMGELLSIFFSCRSSGFGELGRLLISTGVSGYMDRFLCRLRRGPCPGSFNRGHGAGEGGGRCDDEGWEERRGSGGRIAMS